MIRIIIVMVFACTMAAAQKPNIVLMVADDLGYNDVSYQGTKYDTPIIDSLANNGATFSRFYSHPGCTPTRAALLTSREPYHYGLHDGVIARYENYGLPRSEDPYLLPNRMKQEGYSTAIVGKWHLGHTQPEWLPHVRGFDHWWGNAYGLVNYYDWTFENTLDMHENGNIVNPDGSYLTDRQAAEAVDYINNVASCSEQPFFLYVPFLAPHLADDFGIEVPSDSLVNAPGGYTTGEKKYWVMCRQLDYAVQSIWNAIIDNSLEGNTIIIFLSDNGGEENTADADNGPLRGDKGENWEGGIRVPMLWYWKDSIAARSISTPVFAADIGPTLYDYIGHEYGDILPEIDGRSIRSLLDGGVIPERNYAVYYTATTPNKVIFDGTKYKYFASTGALYNVVDDIGETADSSATYTALVAELQAVADSIDNIVIDASRTQLYTPPPGWNVMDYWADPKTFYNSNYYYYRSP